LTRQFDGNLKDSFNKLIEKYQGVWLLEQWERLKWSETLASIIYDLVAMNASMKHFIMIGGNLWDKWLRDYNWCFWNNDEDVSEINVTFSTLMGDNVEPRREFIEANAKYVQNLDI
jgi:hypothetical protein